MKQQKRSNPSIPTKIILVWDTTEREFYAYNSVEEAAKYNDCTSKGMLMFEAEPKFIGRYKLGVVLVKGSKSDVRL